MMTEVNREALRQYHAKRDFPKTPKPRDGGSPGRDALVFVVPYTELDALDRALPTTSRS